MVWFGLMKVGLTQFIHSETVKAVRAPAHLPAEMGGANSPSLCSPQAPFLSNKYALSVNGLPALTRRDRPDTVQS